MNNPAILALIECFAAAAADDLVRELLATREETIDDVDSGKAGLGAPAAEAVDAARANPVARRGAGRAGPACCARAAGVRQ